MKPRLLLVTLGLLLAATAAQAQLYYFGINLNGSQELHNPDTDGWGSGTATLEWSTREFTLDFSFGDLEAPTVAAHIHAAPAGVNGPVIIPLSLSPLGDTFGTGHFEGIITETQAWDMIAENTYLNIHTTAYPAGEIRGQLLVAGAVPEPSTYALFGAAAILSAVVVRRFKAGEPRPSHRVTVLPLS